MKNDRTLTLLGYKEIIESVKKHTSSSLGKKLSEDMMPSEEPRVVLKRYEEVKEAVKIINEGTGLGLGGINDITPFISKIERGSFLHPEELLKVADFLRCIRNLKKSIERYEYLAPILHSYSISLGTFKPIESDIEYCIEGSIVHSRATNALEKIRRKMEALHSKRVDKLNRFLSATGNARHLQENYFSQRDDRYVIPLKASSRNNAAAINV